MTATRSTLAAFAAATVGALIAVFARRRVARIASALVLWVFSVLGMWSVGLFFIPAAIWMTVAATRTERTPARPDVTAHLSG